MFGRRLQPVAHGIGEAEIVVRFGIGRCGGDSLLKHGDGIVEVFALAQGIAVGIQQHRMPGVFSHSGGELQKRCGHVAGVAQRKAEIGFGIGIGGVECYGRAVVGDGLFAARCREQRIGKIVVDDGVGGGPGSARGGRRLRPL